jgi:hypothetical protein
MSDDTVHISYRTPRQLGWLRRPELDRPGVECWEQPDGTLYGGEPGRTKDVFFPVVTPPPLIWPKNGPVVFKEVP